MVQTIACKMAAIWVKKFYWSLLWKSTFSQQASARASTQVDRLRSEGGGVEAKQNATNTPSSEDWNHGKGRVNLQFESFGVRDASDEKEIKQDKAPGLWPWLSSMGLIKQSNTHDLSEMFILVFWHDCTGPSSRRHETILWISENMECIGKVAFTAPRNDSNFRHNLLKEQEFRSTAWLLRNLW